MVSTIIQIKANQRNNLSVLSITGKIPCFSGINVPPGELGESLYIPLKQEKSVNHCQAFLNRFIVL